MFRLAFEEDYEKIIELFHICFGDPVTEIQTFMDFFTKQNDFHMGICEKENKIVSMACLIPALLQNKPAFYVYAVCTHPDFRNQGLSAGLMDFLKDQTKAMGAFCLFLVPATRELQYFYEKQDFLCFPKEFPPYPDFFAECPSGTDTFPVATPKYTCESTSVSDYLILREVFAKEPFVFSYYNPVSAFALEQRDENVFLLKISSPDFSAPLGAIIYKNKKEATLLEVTSWNRKEQILSLKILSDYFSKKFSVEALTFEPGNTLCVYPLKNINIPKNPYFAFPMDAIL